MMMPDLCLEAHAKAGARQMSGQHVIRRHDEVTIAIISWWKRQRSKSRPEPACVGKRAKAPTAKLPRF